MESNLNIDVSALDAPHRRALEEVIGRQLGTNQRLIISVVNVNLAAPETPASAASQDVPSWWNVYEGLSDEEIDRLDQAVSQRANLTRHFE